MAQDFTRQNLPLLRTEGRFAQRELPIGSELMIAVAVGAVGWWCIARLVMWLAG